MKVLLVGNSARDRQISMLMFGELMRSQLALRQIDVRLVQPPTIVGAFAGSGRLSKWFGYVDKLLLYPLRLRKQARWADLVHICDHSNAFYAGKHLGCPVMVTCHDVLAIQAALGMVSDVPVSRTGRVLQQLIRNGLGRCQLVCCISDRTRIDLLALGDVSPENTRTIYNGLNADFGVLPREHIDDTLRPLGIDTRQRYLLHVGSGLKRKNRMTVLRAFAALIDDVRCDALWPGLRMVFVGERLGPDMAAFIAEKNLGNRVLTVSDIDHPQLRACYAGALALLFPSTSEGFGWPLIEAQACGCPVITSDLSPMNQIGGSAALYVAPFDHEAIAALLLENAHALEEIGRRGIVNAARFTTKDMVDGYIDTYQGLLERSA